MKGLSAGERNRKLLHVAVGGLAFLLRWLSWPQAALLAFVACLFNWQMLPRIGGKALWREVEHARGHARGIVLYPLAVLALVLVFHGALWRAAMLWGILAFGDGMASLVGQALGGPRLPWNPQKGWLGLGAFVLFGTISAAWLAGWTLCESPLAFTTLAFFLTLACAIVESLPTTLDDNVTVPIVGALLLPLLERASVASLVSPGLASRATLGLVVNAVIATAAWRVGTIDVSGAASAVLIGALVSAAFGLRGLTLLIVFFVVGSLATRLGYGVKRARGIAQERGGARGWRNAWANGGVPALLAVLACLTPAFAAFYLIAYAAAVATAAADTSSSEIGKVYGRRTVLITTLRAVPPGTEGAVSLEGTLAGAIGASLVAGAGAVLHLYGWRVALVIATAGLIGSLLESVIGTAAERKGWMGNDLLNLINTALGAGIAVLLLQLGSKFWSSYS